MKTLFSSTPIHLFDEPSAHHPRPTSTPCLVEFVLPTPLLAHPYVTAVWAEPAPLAHSCPNNICVGVCVLPAFTCIAHTSVPARSVRGAGHCLQFLFIDNICSTCPCAGCSAHSLTNTGWLRSQPSFQATPAATFRVLLPEFITNYSLVLLKNCAQKALSILPPSSVLESSKGREGNWGAVMLHFWTKQWSAEQMAAD